MRRLLGGFLAGVSLLAFFSAIDIARAADVREGKSGQVTGVVTAKGEDWIEVKADKAKTAERYVPFFTVGMVQDGKGGPPQVGGQFDMGIVDEIRKAPLGARVELAWQFQQQLRIVTIKIFDKKTPRK